LVRQEPGNRPRQTPHAGAGPDVTVLKAPVLPTVHTELAPLSAAMRVNPLFLVLVLFVAIACGTEPCAQGSLMLVSCVDCLNEKDTRVPYGIAIVVEFYRGGPVFMRAGSWNASGLWSGTSSYVAWACPGYSPTAGRSLFSGKIMSGVVSMTGDFTAESAINTCAQWNYTGSASADCIAPCTE